MKIGRNDPCPCGSGKKYKHCCLAKSQGMPLRDKWALALLCVALAGIALAIIVSTIRNAGG